MRIREAKAEDLAGWSSMRSRLWPDTQDMHLGELTAYFEGTSIDIEQAYLLLTDDDEPAGFLELNIREFAEGSRHPKIPYVEAWYVDERFRGRGYGSLLMKQAEEWAQSRGFCELASDTEITNTNSITMHKKLGFVETERVVCFLKKLR